MTHLGFAGPDMSAIVRNPCRTSQRKKRAARLAGRPKGPQAEPDRAIPRIEVFPWKCEADISIIEPTFALMTHSKHRPCSIINSTAARHACVLSTASVASGMLGRGLSFGFRLARPADRRISSEIRAVKIGKENHDRQINHEHDVARARGSHQRSSRARTRGVTTALLLLSSIRTDDATS